ncbi:MAG: PAS domain S-box protein, partial [Methanospirillaceae archaeon]|nr:PAS domain S-box protein [Methanospirillaceae archaeon]
RLCPASVFVIFFPEFSDFLDFFIRATDSIDEEKIIGYASEIGADKNEFSSALAEVPVMSPGQFEKVADLLFFLANELSLKAYQNVQQARFITERQNAVDALNQQLYFLQLLIDTIPNPVFFKDPQGQYTGCNRAFEEFLGLSKYQIIGKSVMQVAPADLADTYDTKDRELFTHPGTQTYEAQVQYADGSLHDVIFYKATFSELQGEVQGLVGVILDITEHKKAEKALRESEQRFRSVLEQLENVAVQAYEPDGTITFWNRASEGLYGFLAEEAIGKDLIELIIDPGEQDTERSLIADCIRTGIVPPASEIDVRNRDGLRMTVLSSRVFHERPGREPEFFCFDVDITKRKHAEEALMRSERERADIINHLPDATFAIDNTGRIIAWNKAIEEMTGFKEEDMLGKGNYEHAIPIYGCRRPILADLIISYNEEFAEKNYTIIRKEGDFLYVETDIPDLRGRSVTLWAKASPLYDERGHKVGAIETIRDITEQKKVETTLIDAKERAEEASRTKSVFLSRMSHELRTPLNAILGFTQIIQKQPNITSIQKRHLGIMLESGEHLLGLINDLLDVGKIEEQKITLEEAPFQPHATLQQAINLQRFKADEKGLSLQAEITTPLPACVQGDERRLRQVILNLLSNAIKFTKKGGITLRAAYEKTGPGSLIIEIIDTGIGIPQDMLTTIFEPFTQVIEPGQIAEGTGLGLTIVNQLVSLMGGCITVESEPGRGSMFRLQIPLPEMKDLQVSEKTMHPVITGYHGKRRSVLVVDDEQTNTTMLVSVLQPLGFEVFTTDNGSEAVELAFRNCPDLILLDLVMPAMDGLDVIKELKSSSHISRTKIMGISAAVSPAVRREEFIASCDDFITKPVNVDIFLEKIQSLLGITWELAVSQDTLISPTEGGKKPKKIPSERILINIEQMVEKGDYDSLEQLLDTLEREDSSYHTFCSEIHTFISRYDDEGILASINRLRKREDE